MTLAIAPEGKVPSLAPTVAAGGPTKAAVPRSDAGSAGDCSGSTRGGGDDAQAAARAERETRDEQARGDRTKRARVG